MAINPSSSIANLINSFTSDFEVFFNTKILSMLSEHVGGYYSVFGVGAVIYLVYCGVMISLGDQTAKDIQSMIRKGLFSLLFLVLGYILIPAMDLFGEVCIDYLSPDDRSYAMQLAIDKSDAMDATRNSEYQLTEADIKNVKESQAAVSTQQYQDAQIDNANDFNEERKGESIWGMIKSGIASVFAKLFLIIGSICKMIITFFMLVIKGLLRITFPIAVSLSLIFKADKALESWWESYITIVMMGVVIAAIAKMQDLMIMDFTSPSLDGSQLGICAMAFAFGVAYLCAPTLTVLCFGGSQAAAQLPQQISSAMMGVAGLTWAIGKAKVGAAGGVLSHMYKDSTTGISERLFK